MFSTDSWVNLTVLTLVPHGTSNLLVAFRQSCMFSSSPLQAPVVLAVGPVEMDGFDSVDHLP